MFDNLQLNQLSNNKKKKIQSWVEFLRGTLCKTEHRPCVKGFGNGTLFNIYNNSIK